MIKKVWSIWRYIIYIENLYVFMNKRLFLFTPPLLTIDTIISDQFILSCNDKKHDQAFLLLTEKNDLEHKSECKFVFLESV